MTTLAERLGHDADARLLIVNCDDLGMCHSANEGVYHSLRHGFATSATLMVPCPWAREAAAQYRGEDVGVDPVAQAVGLDRDIRDAGGDTACLLTDRGVPLR